MTVVLEYHIRCIRVTVVLEYISSQPRGVQLARPVGGEVILCTVQVGSPYSIAISPPRSLFNGCGCKPITNGIPIAKLQTSG